MEQQLLSILDFTKAYRISRSTIYRELSAGRLQKIKIGTRSFITVEEADRWLAAVVAAPAAEKA